MNDDAAGLLSALRGAGWMVAVHNDYRLAGQPHTFWLFTHPSGVWVKGEGRSDAEALREAQVNASARLAGFEENASDIADRLRAAQAGCRRALDLRTATPEGLAIKADVRRALVASGDPGPWGEVGAPMGLEASAAERETV